MDIGMLIAVVMVPVVCGIIATHIITRVQNVLARRRESSQTGTNEDSSL